MLVFLKKRHFLILQQHWCLSTEVFKKVRMRFTSKLILRFKECFLVVALWTIGFLFYGAMAYSMADESHFDYYKITITDFLLLELYGSLVLGFFMGISIFLMQEYVYPHFFRKYGMFLTIIVQALFFVIVCVLGLWFILELNRFHFIHIDNMIVPNTDVKWMISFTFYCLILHVFIHLFLAFRRSLGKNYFQSLLRGNYRVPVIEYRVFMFLDMHSSTKTAEESGHYNYSLLLQECFDDLSEILLDFDAEVYQYVGDEAVLTWKVNDGFNRLQCIQLYDAFCERLLKREKFYVQKFSLLPKFKAAVNEGLVTVAEIGRVKTEIAYHGEVLSTASRVQKLCNQHTADLLITQSFFEQLDSQCQNAFIEVDTAFLRGKKKAVTLYKKMLHV